MKAGDRHDCGHPLGPMPAAVSQSGGFRMEAGSAAGMRPHRLNLMNMEDSSFNYFSCSYSLNIKKTLNDQAPTPRHRDPGNVANAIRAARRAPASFSASSQHVSAQATQPAYGRSYVHSLNIHSFRRTTRCSSGHRRSSEDNPGNSQNPRNARLRGFLLFHVRRTISRRPPTMRSAHGHHRAVSRIQPQHHVRLVVEPAAHAQRARLHAEWLEAGTAVQRLGTRVLRIHAQLDL